jgi:sugar/nucleoside kinase (ribokinase family)
MLFNDQGVFVVPAFPSAAVIDPTGAGDSFAGGLLGYLASEDGALPAQREWTARLRRAMAYGAVIASLTVEGFGLSRLQRATRQEIDQRLEQYRQMILF